MSETRHYASISAFEAALRDRLRSRITPERAFEDLRKQVAFDRVLARLYAAAPDAWLLKGGVALEYRIARARATKDIDISAALDLDGMTEVLARAAAIDLDDYFQIIVGERERPIDDVATFRFSIAVEYANGRRFTELKLDIGFADPWIGVPVSLEAPALLDFAGVMPATVRAIPAAQHLAEKVHAYTRLHGTRPSSRVKDLVDMMLLLREGINVEELQSALQAVFVSCKTHALPTTLPPPPKEWRVPYAKLASNLPVPPDLDGGYQFTATMLDPILLGGVEQSQLRR